MAELNNSIFEQGIKYFVTFAYIETALKIFIPILTNRLQTIAHIWFGLGWPNKLSSIHIGLIFRPGIGIYCIKPAPGYPMCILSLISPAFLSQSSLLNLANAEKFVPL